MSENIEWNKLMEKMNENNGWKCFVLSIVLYWVLYQLLDWFDNELAFLKGFQIVWNKWPKQTASGMGVD